jgi:hypothetical protein
MKLAQLFFGIGYMLVTLAFAIAGLALVGFALVEMGQALGLGDAESIIVRFNRILYSIGLLTIAIASLELGEQPTRLRILWGGSPHTVSCPKRTVSISTARGGNKPR